MRQAIVLLVATVVAACATVPVFTKVEMRSRLVREDVKHQNYRRLARYWDDNAKKLMIDLTGASFLTVWEDEGRAEITVGNGPYYGMIELLRIEEKRTRIHTYSWGSGGIAEKIEEWRTLLMAAPEE